MNGTADHVHALLSLSRVNSIAEIVEELKTSTSKWIKTKGSEFHGFQWQNGYAHSPSANPMLTKSSSTFGVRRSTIEGDRSKTSFARCWSGTSFRSTSDTCGIECDVTAVRQRGAQRQSAPLGLRRLSG